MDSLAVRNVVGVASSVVGNQSLSSAASSTIGLSDTLSLARSPCLSRPLSLSGGPHSLS